MRRRTITIDPFDPASIRDAITACNNEVAEFERLVDEFLRRVAELGRETAQGAYGPTVTSGVTVTTERTNEGYVIKANGREVVFLEFGAGLLTNANNRYAQAMPFPVSQGSYSESVKGPYWKTGFLYWHYGGDLLRYIVPRNAMESAYGEIMRQIKRIADEVFT